MDYNELQEALIREPKTWLITGVAGFVGSNLLETLLKLNQRVVGIDNFVTGYRENLEEVRWSVSTQTWRRLTFIRGSVGELRLCRKAVKGVDYVLHQAALDSVPRSLKTPLATNEVNVNGFLNLLLAARDAEVRRVVYAGSNAVYGDRVSQEPITEDCIAPPTSPYAVSKRVNELYAESFAHNYELSTVGLRYFNVFGRRQSAEGPYASLIPRWAHSLINGKDACIHGDGRTSRDFCSVDDVVQANLLASCGELPSRTAVYNVGSGRSTSLNHLYALMRDVLAVKGIRCAKKPVYTDCRPGDIRHLTADIGAIQRDLGFEPAHNLRSALGSTMDWYLKSPVERRHAV